MLDGQEEAVLVLEAVDGADYILFPVLHLLLLGHVDGDLEEVGAGDVLVPFEALVGDLDVLFGVGLFGLGLGGFVAHRERLN